MEMNSKEYWDTRFEGSWGKNSGNHQTAGFAAMFIDNLPASLGDVFKRGCTLCDWGCAEGEAARALSLAFPSLEVAGVDFSETAVANASARYPNIRFLCQDWVAGSGDAERYDCVFASNVLEHFPNPFDILWNVLAPRAKTYLVIMVPFEEPVERMCLEHVARFTYSSFPLQQGDWTCVCFKVLDPVVGVFNARECMVVYTRAKGDWTLADVTGGTDFDARHEVERLRHENAVLLERIKTVQAQRQVRYEQDKQIIQESSTLKKKIASLEADLKSARESAKRALAESSVMEASLSKCEKEAASKLAAASREREALVQRIASLECSLKDAERSLKDAERSLKDAERSLKSAEARYQKLARSKLGRLTLRFWKFKDAVKARLRGGKPAHSEKPAETGNGAEGASAPPKKLPCGDEGFFERMAEKIKGMPESNGCRYYERLKRRIAIICDRFYWDSVKAAADFVYIDPAKWRDCIKDIDCLLVVSAWHGLGDGTDWRGLPYKGSARRELACEIIDICKGRGIPTIFYSKEDPPSYADFLELAQRCDYVFTSDAGCVPRYKEDCGHDRVFPMCFCINPTYHNPVGSRHCAKERNVFFAGSWMKKFPVRCQDMERMLDGVLDAGRGLNIVDRCYALRGDERYSYPEKYLKFQAPAVDHDSLQKIHKLYDWCININTVKGSSTMFANRVYELQANGNLLISNYSMGVSNAFPNVFLIHDKEEVGQILNGFTEDEVYERQTAGVRRVMTGETCFDRVAEMLRAVGLAEPPPVRKVLVIATKATDRVKEMFELQTYGEKTLTDLDHVTPGMYADADIVAFFDADADYGAYYLEDMVNGFKYTSCDYVTKAAYVNAEGVLVKGKEHDYVSEYADRTRTVFWREAFTLEELLGATGAVERGNGYASDHFSYALRPQALPRIEAPAVSAVIPVHNNGRFLYGRAFAALRRSSLFPRMEIIIVDDGSTDGWTPKVVRELERRYPNVRTHFFGDGGSGSPSRPRNQGVKMAKAPCIIFHDPDNEGIRDGYAALYNALQKSSETDFTIGNTVRCDGRLMTVDYYDILKKSAGGTSLTNGREALVSSGFLPVNIQAMAIRRSFLLGNGLEQVPGGIGEDSLLSNQMMFAARRFEALPVKAQIYYAERGDSIVNSVTPKFFDKHMLTEVARVKWLVAVGLMEAYAANRLAAYVVRWYFDRLRHADPALADACAQRLFDILKLYDGFYKGGTEAVDAFLDKCRAGDFHGAYDGVLAMKKQGGGVCQK